MIQTWDTICLRAGDAALGWTLDYPRDLLVIALGLCLGVVLHLVRRYLTDQQLLEQITTDQKRLQVLIHAARADNDHERLQRFRHIRDLVRARRSQAELVSVGVSFLILAAVTTWGQHRLGSLPWRRGDTVHLSVQTPPAAIGKVIHAMPAHPLVSPDGWIRKIRADTTDGQPVGKAEWSFRLEWDPHRTIVLRWEEGTVVHQLMSPQWQIADAIQQHDGSLKTHVAPKPYRPVGLLPQHILPGMPGWALLLILVTTPVFVVLRRFESGVKSD